MAALSFDDPGASWEDRAVAVVRGLALDAPFAARNGHSGTAMALAPLGVALFSRVLRHDPTEPAWPDRDRFVLSCGHASILLYSLLHLSGYDLPLDQLKRFRELGSITPGHPENLLTPGVEVTTGPLGQGFSNAVGMAIAERFLRHSVSEELVDHHTWVFASDGDLMEGVSHEAASIAGHLGLSRLCAVYDDNHITIDGPTELAFTDDTAGRFRAYGWDVHELGEVANDLDVLTDALRAAKQDTGRPTLLVLRSHIGYPAPTWTDNHEAHGTPFPEAELLATKRRLGLPVDEPFFVPQDVRDAFIASLEPMRDERASWQERYAKDPDRAALLDRFLAGGGGAPRTAPLTFPDDPPLATRSAAATLLSDAATRLPGLLSGAADLTGNTGAKLADASNQSRDNPLGRQLHYGIREFGMAGALTGMAMHGGIVPVGATFFVFSDYMRSAIRVAALSKAPVRYLFSHDSIGVGQDGPTHQPVDQLCSLRAIPGLDVIRPADANECAAVFDAFLAVDGPAALILSRQTLPVLEATTRPVHGTALDGAYVLAAPDGAEATLLATGSEVHLCLEAAALLATSGTLVRVVSMPCWEWFDRTPFAYQAVVLPEELPVISVEAGVTLGWERYADESIGIDQFGTSAPGDVALEFFGFTASAVVATVQEVLGA
ncbi:MAG TPA: transketolase [Acidimicrobiales bacterium]|nr:transketolase [Acidimicrobiales bacterium]